MKNATNQNGGLFDFYAHYRPTMPRLVQYGRGGRRQTDRVIEYDTYAIVLVG